MGRYRTVATDFMRGFWRVVCSYMGAEASGQDWDVTLAIPESSGPLQAIEKRKLKSVPIWAFATAVFEGQAFGRNGKTVGPFAARRARAGEHFLAKGGI